VTPPSNIVPGENENDPPVIYQTLAAAGQGGGLFVGNAGLKLSHSVFTTNLADISGGGLYVTGEVPVNSRIFNCLFDNNVGRRDGGGASVNWFAVSSFANCTFAANQSIGRGGDYSVPALAAVCIAPMAAMSASSTVSSGAITPLRDRRLRWVPDILLIPDRRP